MQWNEKYERGLSVTCYKAFVAALFCLLAGPALFAQEAEEEEETAGGPKITIHGYLTQAYGQTDGHQYIGISEDGTADYRTAALQIRADISKNDTFAVQLSHERFGESPIQSTKEEVELDWIFYEHRFGKTALKVGRVQLPFGIYNEIRDVGTLLPFYRPPLDFYADGTFSTETVDGIAVSRDFDLAGDWNLETDVAYGDFEYNFELPTGFSPARVSDSVTAAAWLDTPVSGLRVGAGAQWYDVTSPSGEKKPWESYLGSVSGEFDRFSLHAEYREINIDGFPFGPGTAYTGYVHLGVNVSDRVTVNAQIDQADLRLAGLPRATVDRDKALGLNYAFSPSLVLKTEHHWVDSSVWLDDLPIFSPNAKARAWILSLSTAF